MDVLRGFAAFSVILYHYRHFYYIPGEGAVPFDQTQQPFYSFLSILYDHGLDAVQAFWVLSGFIFFTLYLKSIRERQVTPYEFFIRRLSRLYPLHFLTLMVVAALQGLSEVMNGFSMIYQQNDIKHFFLNLGFITAWGLEEGLSFNAPIWSVSVEIFAYIAFFLFAYIGLRNILSMVIVIGAGIAFAYKFNSWLGAALACFFIGGLTQKFTDFTSNKSLRLSNLFLIIALLVGLASAAGLAADWVTSPYRFWIKAFGLFPAFIGVAALLQQRKAELGRSLRSFGDVSYSVYLWQIPIQLLILNCATFFGFAVDPHLGFFIFYLASVYLVGWLSYRFIERPAQNALRARFGSRSSPEKPA